MACKILDGFDHISQILSDQLSRKHTLTYQYTASQHIMVPGRFGGQAIRFDNANRGFSDTFTDQATWIVGCAFRFATFPATRVLFEFLDTATSHVDLRIQTNGILQATRNGTSLGTGTTALSTNTWYYVETKVTINDSTGVFAAQLNGVSEINLTSQDTRNAGNSTANVVKLLGVTNSGGNVDVDDYYVFDGTGSFNNDFAGVSRVFLAGPAEPGNYAQWTPTDGTNLGNVIDPSSADDDASFNYTSTANNIDSFKFDDSPLASGNIKAFQHVLLAKHDGGGARSLAALQRSSSTDYAETGQSLSSSYKYYKFPRDTNPATSAAMTAAEFASAEMGYKLIS